MMHADDVLPDRAPDMAERPAALHLVALGATDEWQRRADWLETEAKAQRDPAARARLLLAASEVRAILGDRADARRLAVQAQNHQPTPPLAARQARALHQMHGDVSAVARGLVEEARSAENPHVKAHSHYLAAEIQRLFQRDPAAARANLDAAEAANPGDGRVSLQRLLLELSQSQQAPEGPLPADAALRRAAQEIGALRGGPAIAAEGDPSDALALAGVQRALSRGDLDLAADALAPLAERPGLLPAVRWLLAFWRAARAERPEAALALHRNLMRDAPGFASRRALAARAVAAGDWTALSEALSEPDDDLATAGEAAALVSADSRVPRAVFSNVERTALAALVRQRATAGSPIEPHEAMAVDSIASAVARASSAPLDAASTPPTGTERAEFALGRAVAVQTHGADGDAVVAAHPWGLVLSLEQSRNRADWSSVARDLPRLLEGPAAVAEASFVAAVFAEKAGNAVAARELYQASQPSPSTREAATRALIENASDGAAPLRALSAHTSDPLRRALLLTEALFRLPSGAPEFDALAEDAARTYPELPLAVELGELAARERGDRARAARWLGRRREHAQGADDQLLATLREALYGLDLDPEGIGDRLREAVARQPDDLVLGLAAERLLTLPARARADFRKRLAPQLSARGRVRFLAEAVSLYRAADERALALAMARELGAPLGELWALRLASTDEDLDAIANDWLRRAQRTGDVELGADLYQRLARLERQRGRPALGLAWLRERLALQPASIEALRALGIENMTPGREAELELTASALFEALGERDGLAHAYVATRLKIARGAFDEARPIVRRVHASAVPPLWALRLDAVYAREAGDDRTLLEACRSLRERSSQALDAATLSLHAAEAALRIGEPNLARDDIQRAGGLAPDDIVILSARAEVLRQNRDHAEAAEAFETLASATSSKRRQVDALYQAALLWLDELDNRARGTLALSEAASLDVPHAGLLERLVALHAQSDDLDGVAELIERQRACAAEPAVDAGVDLSRALDYAENGRLGDARSLLSALLEREPEDPDVLHASAQVHVRAGEWARAEREWRRLLELGASETTRLDALSGLASLYEAQLPNPEQLSSLYPQILSRDPDNVGVRQRLVTLLASCEAWPEAAAQQRELLARALDEEERKTRLLYLVELLDRSAGGASEAEALLVQARRTWSDDPRVLQAEVAHYESLGHSGTARVIVERAVTTARGAILAGRIEPAAFRTLEIAARLQGDAETARAAQVMASAIIGAPRLDVPGAGPRAGESDLDDLTAPALLPAELRHLLFVAGAAIERAYGVDPRSANVSPAPEALTGQVRELALGFGLEHVRVFVSSEIGTDCRCLGTAPVSVVLGTALVEREDSALSTFLVLRALVIAKVNACALSVMTSEEAWSTLAGFFACFGQPWPATGQDAHRLLAARNRIRPHLTWVPEPDLSGRIADLMDEVLPRAGDIGEALFRWGARVAMLGVGDPIVALESLQAQDARGPRPTDEAARMRWIAGHAEARDLVSYGISEAYIAARQRAGLAAAFR
jgi:hypothetical protein